MTTQGSLLKLHDGTRKKPRPGDIFAQRLKHNRQYIWGRVVHADATCGPATGLLLLYIYHPSTDNLTPPVDLNTTRLLLPPIIANRQGWLRGYYKTIENRVPRKEEILQQHCFEYLLDGEFRDEYGAKLPRRTEPCGIYGVASYIGVGELIAHTLGLPIERDID
ncbi:MAG: hypothetical protein KDE31_24970 [Caldilineaceae bacterium]|nr:hypothetical protein [Caldilineaceae bacterium]